MSRDPTAWLVRAGRNGQRDDFALTEGLAGGGFADIADLTAVTERDEIAALVRAANPDDSANRIANYTGQLLALRSKIQTGDYIVLPLKTTKQVAVGVALGGYIYRDDPDPTLRHVIPVDWKQSDVPRTAIKQDLLYSIGSALTVCQVTRNDAVQRIVQIASKGVDPGARVEAIEEIAGAAEPLAGDGAIFDLEQVARDQISNWIVEHFDGFALEELVAAVLEAEGFITQVSPQGGDGGVDIVAGSGPLGFDTPRLVVQVKSEAGPVKAKVARELQGVMSSYGADQALLVAWGGVNTTARQELRNQFFQLRVWDADDLIDSIFKNYSRLPESLRAELPLKQVWTIVGEDRT